MALNLFKGITGFANTVSDAVKAAANGGDTSYGANPGGAVNANSASGVTVSSAQQDSIRQQMNANSNAWHTADDATKRQLEQANKNLAAQLGGSVSFNPNSGTWSGAADGVTVGGKNYKDGNEYINSIYDAYLKQELDKISASEAKVDPYYYGVRNQAANAMAQNKASFNEFSAANGLNSGAGGQAELSRQNVYGNALSAADIAEADAYNQLNLQRSQAKSENDIARAKAQYDELVRRQEYEQAQKQFDTEMKYRYDTLDFDKQQSAQNAQSGAADTEYKRMVYLAESLAANGDFSGYKALGYSDAQIAAAEKQYQDAQALAAYKTYKSASGSSGSSSGGNESQKSMTLAQAQKYAEDGVFTSAVLNTLYEYGFNDADLKKAYGYEAPQPASTSQPVNRYSSVKSELGSMLYAYGRKGETNDQLAQHAIMLINNRLNDGSITSAEANSLADYVASLMKK